MSSKIKMLNSREKIYEGSSKILYEIENDPATLIQFFKDDMILKNGEKIDVSGKGIIKNNISSFIMDRMNLAGLDNHYIEKLNMREQKIDISDVVPVHVVISNISSGRYVEQFGIEEGYVFDAPIIDFRVKNREKGHPTINEYQMVHFGWLDEDELDELLHIAFRANDFLSGLFAGVGIRLVEASLEFGRVFDGEDFKFIIVDEITPDNCKLWDIETNEKLDFEYAMENPGNAISIYKEVAKRFKI